jgi:hypothetical protein
VIGWAEGFAVLVVSHLVGDFLLQTQWQALNKPGGLGRDPSARRALLTHVLTYTAAYIPALIWLGDALGAGVVAIAALIAIPHLVQDDARLVKRYIRTVKHLYAQPGEPVYLLVDQSLHVVSLFGVALLAHAMS